MEPVGSRLVQRQTVVRHLEEQRGVGAVQHHHVNPLRRWHGRCQVIEELHLPRHFRFPVAREEVEALLSGHLEEEAKDSTVTGVNSDSRGLTQTFSSVQLD